MTGETGRTEEVRLREWDPLGILNRIELNLRDGLIKEEEDDEKKNNRLKPFLLLILPILGDEFAADNVMTGEQYILVVKLKKKRIKISKLKIKIQM